MNRASNTFFFGMMLFLCISMYLGYDNDRLEKEISRLKDCNCILPVYGDEVIKSDD